MQIVSTICMNCKILFSGKNKKNITNLLSAELDQRVVKIKALWKFVAEDIQKKNDFVVFQKNKTRQTVQT